MERDLKNLWQYKIRRQQDFLSQIDTNAPEKRKERADTDTGKNTEKGHGCDLGDQKKPKLIHADDSQNGALEAIPNIGEFHISISFFFLHPPMCKLLCCIQKRPTTKERNQQG